MAARYVAEGGRVYAIHEDGTKEEAGTALTANGRDLELHDRALQEASRQREAMRKEPRNDQP